MRLLLNDLSLHGQFRDPDAFRQAVTALMKIRNAAQRYGRELHCHRNVANAQVTAAEVMPQVLGLLPANERRALMQWLTRHGPFWDDDKAHGPDHYLECNQQIVTDTAIGEAAFCCVHGLECHLVSIFPSDWIVSPLHVAWHPDLDGPQNVQVRNHWASEQVLPALQAASPPLARWSDLDARARVQCDRLTFAVDAFDSLAHHPFAPGPAEQILIRLQTLQRLVNAVDESGARTTEGDRIYQDHFVGDKAWFTDSSKGEKSDFEEELTFRHPDKPGEYLFCTWHGKVKTPQYRIHFAWPSGPTEPVYVVYVGPKLTKR